MKRIFVAVPISAEARRRAASYIESLRAEFREARVGWEKAEKLHLTLKFLGDCDERQLRNLENAVANSAKSFFDSENIANFKIQISETGVFPSKRNGRILWLGLHDESGNLAKINRILETECEKMGFEKENRSFKPHLTIARLKEPHKSGHLAEKHLENTFEPVEFEVSEIVIYESKLQPTGSIYRKLKSFEFSK